VCMQGKWIRRVARGRGGSEYAKRCGRVQVHVGPPKRMLIDGDDGSATTLQRDRNRMSGRGLLERRIGEGTRIGRM